MAYQPAGTTIQDSNQKTLQIRILGSKNLVRASLKVNPAITQDEEACGRQIRAGGRFTGDAARFWIKAKISKSETILETMCGKERGDAVNIAQTKDQSDDGLRGDGIEAGGRRVVENDGRMIYEGACDGDTAAHAAGEFGRKKIHGVLKFDEAEHFLNARDDLVLAETVFGETVGDIVADGERIEEGAFLKDKTDLTAEGEEVMLAHGRDAIAEDIDLAAVGAKETSGHLESEGFAGAGFTEEDEGFARLSAKGDPAENVAVGEANVDIGKLDNGLAVGKRGDRGRNEGRIHGVQNTFSAR